MPRTAITLTDVTRAGVTQPAQQNSDNVNGMALPYNDGRIVLEITSTTTTVFTFPFPVTVDGQSVTSRQVSVTTGTIKLVGPFPPGLLNQPDGTLSIDCDNANGRIRAYHLPS